MQIDTLEVQSRGLAFEPKLLIRCEFGAESLIVS